MKFLPIQAIDGAEGRPASATKSVFNIKFDKLDGIDSLETYLKPCYVLALISALITRSAGPSAALPSPA